MKAIILLNAAKGLLSELLIRGNATPLAYGFIVALSVALLIPIAIIICLAVSIKKELKKREERLSAKAKSEEEHCENLENSEVVEVDNDEITEVAYENIGVENSLRDIVLDEAVDEQFATDFSFAEIDEQENAFENIEEPVAETAVFAESEHSQSEHPMESIDEVGEEPLFAEEEKRECNTPSLHIEETIDEVPVFAVTTETESDPIEIIEEVTTVEPSFAYADGSDTCLDNSVNEPTEDLSRFEEQIVEAPLFSDIAVQEDIPPKGIEENPAEIPLFAEDEEPQSGTPIEHIDEVEKDETSFAEIKEEESAIFVNIEEPKVEEPIFAEVTESDVFPLEGIAEPIGEPPAEAPCFVESESQEVLPIQNIEDVSIEMPIFAESEEQTIGFIDSLEEVSAEEPLFAESEEEEFSPIRRINEPVSEVPEFALSENSTADGPMENIAEPATQVPVFAEAVESEQFPVETINAEAVKQEKGGEDLDTKDKRHIGKSLTEAPFFIGVEEVDPSQPTASKEASSIRSVDFIPQQIEEEEPVNFILEEGVKAIPSEIEELPEIAGRDDIPDFELSEEKETNFAPKRIKESVIEEPTPNFAEASVEIKVDIPKAFESISDSPAIAPTLIQEKEVNRAIPKGLYDEVPEDEVVEEKEEGIPSIRLEDIQPELTKEERAAVDKNEALLKSLMESEEDEIKEDISGDEDIPVVIIGVCTDTSAFTAFEHKLLDATNVQKYIFSEIKNTLLSYKHVKDKISNAGDAFRQGSNLIARITLNGGKLRLHLCLNPKAYSPKVYKHYSLKHIAAYAVVPFTIELANRRDLVNACKLIQDAMASKFIIYTNDKREYIDYAALYTMKECD